MKKLTSLVLVTALGLVVSGCKSPSATGAADSTAAVGTTPSVSGDPILQLKGSLTKNTDSLGNLDILGQVENTGGDAVWVRANCNLFDSNSTLIAAEGSYITGTVVTTTLGTTTDTGLKTGDTGTFDIRTSTPIVDVADIQCSFSYDLLGGDTSAGGAAEPTAVVKTAVFIDAPVQGLSYKTLTQAGVTNEDGEFNYLFEELITFNIGGIEFSVSVPADGIVTPLTIFKTTDINDPSVVNMARLLQTLDSDRNPDNGVLITPETRLNAAGITDINFANTVEFESDVAELLVIEDVALVSAGEATLHLQQSIASATGAVGDTVVTPPVVTNNLNDISGIWRGTMSSASRGTQSIDIIVDSNQRIRVTTQAGSQMAGDVSKGSDDVIKAIINEYASVASNAQIVAEKITFTFSEISNDISLKGSFVTGTETGTFQVNYDASYEKDSSLTSSTVVDIWQSGTELLSINTANIFSGNGVKGCEYKGTIGLIDPAVNIYNLNVTASTCTDIALNADYSGLAWLEGGDSENNIFNYSVVNNQHALSGKLNRVDKTDTGTPVTSAANVSGFWTGSMSNPATGQVTSIEGVITENNRFKLIEAGTNIQYSGIVVSADNGDVSVDVSIFNNAETGNALKTGNTTFNFKTVNEKSNITGTFDLANDGSEDGDFSLSYVSIYERTSELAKVVGDWGDITVDTSNAFFGQGLQGCTYAGNIGIINPISNVYNLNITANGCDGALSGEYFGVAWLGDSAFENDTMKYSVVKSDGTASLSSQLSRIVVGQTPAVSGIWRGSITSEGGKVTSIATGIITENGAMQLTTSDGDVISGKLGVDTGVDVSASATFYKADRSERFGMDFSGTITEKSLLEGTYTSTDPLGLTGAFSLAYSEDYDSESKQSLLSGSWSEEFESILLNSVGLLEGTNTSTNCILTGSMGILSPTFNAYNVNIKAEQCTNSALNGDYAGLATLSDGNGDGNFDALIYIVNNDSQYLTNIFTKAASLASITGIWRGTFTNNDGISTFYKGLISENNEVKLLADTESFPFDQGSDIISGAAAVHTKDSIVANLKEIPANNNPNDVLDVVLKGVVIEGDSMSGTYTKSATATKAAEFGSFSFKYDEVYTIPEVNFFVINDTRWNVEKFNNNAGVYYRQYLALSRSFVLSSDSVVVSEPVSEVKVVSIVEAVVTADFDAIPAGVGIKREPISTEEVVGNITTNVVGERVTETKYEGVNHIFEVVTVTKDTKTTKTTIDTNSSVVTTNGVPVVSVTTNDVTADYDVVPSDSSTSESLSSTTETSGSIVTVVEVTRATDKKYTSTDNIFEMVTVTDNEVTVVLTESTTAAVISAGDEIDSSSVITVTKAVAVVGDVDSTVTVTMSDSTANVNGNSIRTVVGRTTGVVIVGAVKTTTITDVTTRTLVLGSIPIGSVLTFTTTTTVPNVISVVDTDVTSLFDAVPAGSKNTDVVSENKTIVGDTTTTVTITRVTDKAYRSELNSISETVTVTDATKTTVTTVDPSSVVEVTHDFEIISVDKADVDVDFDVLPASGGVVENTTDTTTVAGDVITRVEVIDKTVTSYAEEPVSITEIVTVTDNTAATVSTSSQGDSNNCTYIGNYDVVEPEVNMWNLYMEVSGCNSLKVRGSDGEDVLVDADGKNINRKNTDGTDKIEVLDGANIVGLTDSDGVTVTVSTVPLDLNGTYTGLATLEEQFGVVDHPHDHFNFMTFGMVDTTGTKTINNRLTLQYFGN